jgi:hypothetical protein
VEGILCREVWSVVEEERGGSAVPFWQARPSESGNQTPREVTLTSVQLLLNKLAEDVYCKSAVGQIRTYLKACFEYATDEDLIEKNPTRKLDMPNIRKKSCERFQTVEELRALMSQASPREHVVLRILAVCELRAAEILVLRIEDFEGTQFRIDVRCAVCSVHWCHGRRAPGTSRASEGAPSRGFIGLPRVLATKTLLIAAEGESRLTPKASKLPCSAPTTRRRVIPEK